LLQTLDYISLSPGFAILSLKQNVRLIFTRNKAIFGIIKVAGMLHAVAASHLSDRCRVAWAHQMQTRLDDAAVPSRMLDDGADSMAGLFGCGRLVWHMPVWSTHRLAFVSQRGFTAPSSWFFFGMEYLLLCPYNSSLAVITLDENPAVPCYQ
jgi:hypothetical protein